MELELDVTIPTLQDGCMNSNISIIELAIWYK